jgi:hypothetical protein
MLQSFIGTYDSGGLRSFAPDEYAESVRWANDNAVVRFWAIIDSDELPSIWKALVVGQRGTALELIAQQAKSLGRCYTP